MKNSGKCVKCNHESVFHSECVMDRGDGNQAMCLSIMRSDPIEAREIGQFEVYVCKKCGYTEFYVRDPKEL